MGKMVTRPITFQFPLAVTGKPVFVVLDGDKVSKLVATLRMTGDALNEMDFSVREADDVLKSVFEMGVQRSFIGASLNVPSSSAEDDE